MPGRDIWPRRCPLRGQGAQIVAGGTDFYAVRVGKPLYDRDVACVLDLTALRDLRASVNK